MRSTYGLRPNIEDIHVDLVSQEEPVTGSLQFRDLHVSLASLSEIGVFHYSLGSDLSLPTSTSCNIKHTLCCLLHFLCDTTRCFVPVLTVFESNMCLLAVSIQPIPTSEPNLFDGFLPLGSRSVCYVCFYTRAFSTAELFNWPANLMCCNVQEVPCAIDLIRLL